VLNVHIVTGSELLLEMLVVTQLIETRIPLIFWVVVGAQYFITMPTK